MLMFMFVFINSLVDISDFIGLMISRRILLQGMVWRVANGNYLKLLTLLGGYGSGMCGDESC
jgi:hypothetical protein